MREAEETFPETRMNANDAEKTGGCVFSTRLHFVRVTQPPVFSA
jgi:hypothetical protein